MVKLTDITAHEHMCKPIGPTCPAVFKTDSGTYIIVGTVVLEHHEMLIGRVGADESAIEINAELLEKAVSNAVKKKDIGGGTMASRLVEAGVTARVIDRGETYAMALTLGQIAAYTSHVSVEDMRETINDLGLTEEDYIAGFYEAARRGYYGATALRIVKYGASVIGDSLSGEG